MKLSPLYVLLASPPPTMSGLKAICSSPIVLGFCRITLLHCAGHRKSNVELSKGPHVVPSCPHPLLASQYVDVQPMKESSGVRNDCARAKKAKPMIYAARKTNNHGEVNGFVVLMTMDSMGITICLPAIAMSMSRKGDGPALSKVQLAYLVFVTRTRTW